MGDKIELDVGQLDELVIAGLRYHAGILKKLIREEIERDPVTLKSRDATQVRAVNLDDMYSDLHNINEVLRYMGSTKIGFQEGYD